MQFSTESLIYGSKPSILRDIYLNGMVDMESAERITSMIQGINEFDNAYDEQRESLNTVNGVKLERVEREPIRLHIASGGGYVNAGMMIMNNIMTSRTEVHAYVTSAGSMAFCITAVCDYRFGYPLTTLMHHDTSFGISDTTQGIKEYLSFSESERDRLDDVLMKVTKLPKELMKEIIDKKLNYNMFIEEAVELGVIDKVIDYNEPAHKSETSAEDGLEVQTSCGEVIFVPFPENVESMSDDELNQYVVDTIQEKTGKAIDEEGYLVPLAEDDERKVVEEVKEDEEVTVRRTMLEDATEEELLDLLMIIGEDEHELIELSMAVEATKDNLIELIMLADF